MTRAARSASPATAPDGQPATVYMGTARPGGFSGGLQAIHGSETGEAGLFFTEHQGTAENYGGGGVIAAHLHVRNPLDATQPLSTEQCQRIAAEFDKHPTLQKNAAELRKIAASGDTNPFHLYSAVAGGGQGGSEHSARTIRRQLLRAMRNLGYDAIKHQDYDLPGAGDSSRESVYQLLSLKTAGSKL